MYEPEPETMWKEYQPKPFRAPFLPKSEDYTSNLRKTHKHLGGRKTWKLVSTKGRH